MTTLPGISSSKADKEPLGASHTPGPWIAVETEDSDYPYCVQQTLADDGDGYYVAAIVAGQEDCKATARLIAAAPDLLEAARLALAESERADIHFRSTSPATLALRTAIAKAMGG